MKKIFMYFWSCYQRCNYLLFKKEFSSLKKKRMKIAVLKPYFYMDLYTQSSKDFSKIIYSSRYRFGPVGLFSDLEADFYITDPIINNDLKEKIFNRIKTNQHKKFVNEQKKNSTKINIINYSKYDLILSYEDAVTEKIVKKYPKINWGLILEDHSNKNFKKYCFYKPGVFDFFLNLTQGYTPYSFFKKKHCIDFSYTFGSTNLLKKLKIKKTFETDIVVEIQQPADVFNALKSKNWTVQKLDGSLNIKDYIKKIACSKIFFCPLFTTPRWGNSLIEAALCKNLIIGNKWGYWNSLLIDKDLHCSSIAEGAMIVSKILSEKKLYNYYLAKQNKMLDNINYKLPLNQIYSILK
jgi:hypothetical protein